MTIMNTTISGGGKKPTGTITITSNTTTNVADYEFAVTEVPTTAPAHYIEKTVDASGKLQNGTNIINLNGVTDIGAYALSGQHYEVSFPANISIDFSSLTTISGDNACSYMFCYSDRIISVDLSGLITISGSSACRRMFYDCESITSVDLSSLTTISGTNACDNMFAHCHGLTNVYFSSLTTISGDKACYGMFDICSNLTSIDFPSLTTIEKSLCPSYGKMFGSCIHLESVKFGGLKSTTFASAVNQLQYLFNNTTGSQAPNGCTVHFPSNFDPSDPNHTFDASTLAGYPAFGGSASYIKIAFDLPATEN